MQVTVLQSSKELKHKVKKNLARVMVPLHFGCGIKLPYPANSRNISPIDFKLGPKIYLLKISKRNFFIVSTNFTENRNFRVFCSNLTQEISFVPTS